MAGIKSKQTLADFSPSYRKQIERAIKQNPGASIEQAKTIIYENRTARALAKNPDVSLAEARGHKPKALPKDATPLQVQERALKEKASNLSLKAKKGVVDPVAAKEAKKILRKMSTETKKMQQHEGEIVGGLSSLEWTKWSQEQKSREVRVKELQANLDPAAAAKAQKILAKMHEETEKMWSMKTRRPGTSGYYKSQDRLKALYKRLEKMGLVNRTGDIIAGDVGYH